MKTQLLIYTFENSKIREWVEENVEGRVLNLFAGKTKLNCDEVRNDIRKEMPADYYKDALDFVFFWKENHSQEPFDTVLLDPPYSYRKSMTKYEGAVSSPFNQIKNGLLDIVTGRGIVITFGHHSVVMGEKRGFVQEHLLLMSHGGAIHDTMAVIERSRRL